MPLKKSLTRKFERIFGADDFGFRVRNKCRGTLISFGKMFEEKKLKNDRNGLIDVKMN
jgi:hypothetical protein